MAIIRRFRSLRPNQDAAGKVASLPYDVYSREEAREAVKGHPLSFLNIDRPETQFGPDFDMYSDAAYEKAKELLRKESLSGRNAPPSMCTSRRRKAGVWRRN